MASGGPQQARGPIERQIRPLERMRMPVATRGKKDDHVITKPPPPWLWQAALTCLLPATRVTHPRELHAERSPPADDVIAPAGPRLLAAEWRNVFIRPSSSNWASVMVSCSTRIRMAPTARDVQLHLFEKK